MVMIKRMLGEKIAKTLQRTPSVALMGPRQVGKTTLALDVSEEFPSLHLDLEDQLDLQKINDFAAFHAENKDKLIILDEIQRLPEIFSSLRGVIDRERRRGNRTNQFLFLGSASIDLLQQSSESLAGRIAYLELFPINLLEFSEENTPDKTLINQLWLRGGFPESLLAASEQNSFDWRRDFIKTYRERDIPQLGARIPAETLDRFWTMLAHSQGTPLNAAQMAKNLEVSGTTVGRYLDLMVDLLLVRRLKPWTYNVGKRLVRSPKVYVRDSGLVHALLNIMKTNDLLGHPVVGGSWEGFIIENILSVLPSGVQPYYYRTSGGAELDLVLEFGVDERWAIEIKRSAAPSLSRGFYTACEDIKATRRYVVYSGQDSFSMGQDVRVVSLFDLMEELTENY